MNRKQSQGHIPKFHFRSNCIMSPFCVLWFKSHWLNDVRAPCASSVNSNHAALKPQVFLLMKIAHVTRTPLIAGVLTSNGSSMNFGMQKCKCVESITSVSWWRCREERPKERSKWFSSVRWSGNHWHCCNRCEIFFRFLPYHSVCPHSRHHRNYPLSYDHIATNGKTHQPQSDLYRHKSPDSTRIALQCSTSKFKRKTNGYWLIHCYDATTQQKHESIRFY